MGATLLVVILTAALFATANDINEQCQVYNETRITCSCIGNEEFLLPEEYNYKNITSVSVTGCVSANLHYASFPEASNLEEMIVQNISGILNFEVFFTSNRVKLLKLSNIGRIPKITGHTFTNLRAIDTLAIEGALIENLEEEFFHINVLHFIMMNVTIERVDRLNVSEKGATLRIVNSELRNAKEILNFGNFDKIEINGSKFEMQKPGVMSIQGTVAIVENSIFSNVSMNLVTTNAIVINGICADGKSTLRLSSKYVNSTDNRLPNEIAYPGGDQPGGPERVLTIRNNTVCKAGNCKCSKSSGQAPYQVAIPIYIFLLTIIICYI
ncbi:uncharacterized protein [Temnothorax longispinosus]|uniref:Uncharacterized protein n=1 Tax=Temnothorax longispinosus TaxID=300112 RepID=A0A4S2KQ20_9HYME|nr:Uncharacterized protein DBV15_10143 [Temnothorax longispinosus]